LNLFLELHLLISFVRNNGFWFISPKIFSIMNRVIQQFILTRSVKNIVWGGLLSFGLLSSSFSILLAATAAPAFAQRMPTSVREAYTLLNRGWVDQAISLFEQATQQYPQLLEARLGLAIAYRRAGRDADSVRAYEQVLTLDSSNRLSLLSLGILGGYRAEWQERGVAALTLLLQKIPDDTEARTQRALLYIYQGQFNAAIQDYELILQTEPKPAALVGAAQAYAYTRNYEKSLALFDRYRQAGGTLQGDAATAYARVLRETGNPTAAIQLLDAHLRQQPRLTGSVLRMRAEQALNYAAIGQINQATTMLAPLRDRTDARMVLGRTLIAIARSNDQPTFLDEGIALFKSVVAEASASVPVKQELAEVLASFPTTQTTALEVYRQLVQKQPEDRGLQTQIAVLEYETRQISEADLLKHLAQILQPIPTDPTQQKLIAQALGRIKTPSLLLLPLYENIVRAGVTEPLLYFHIAEMYLRQRDYKTARSVIATYQTTPIGKTDLAAELALAGIEQRQGHWEASDRRYQSILESDPKDQGILMGALQGLAGIYQAQRKFQEALVLYNRVIALNPEDATKQLGLASLQYQAKILSRSEAEAVLNRWLMAQTLMNTPPELYSLAGALPANPARELLYRSLLQADPNNMPVQTRLVEVMTQHNRTAAQAYVDQLVAHDPDNLDVYFLQGQIAQQMGDLRQSASAYEEILKREPQDVNALASLGGVRFQQRRYQAAIDLYSQILAIQPDHAIARSALSSLENIGRYPRRIAALRRAQQMEQAEPVILPFNRLQLQSQSPSPLESSLEPQPDVEFLPQGNTPLPWASP
jgi:cellulose synthase operon protein C